MKKLIASGLKKIVQKMESDVQELKHKGEIREIALNKIRLNPFQPRKLFSEEEIEELASSIREVGLIQPPVVRPLEEGDEYELIAGERRFRAAQLAGLEQIYVLVRKSTDEESAKASLIENMQRVDLNPIEVSKALRLLADEFGYSQEELAQKVGKKRSTVTNYLRLLTLPQSIQDSVSNNAITMGHAKVILSLEGEKEQETLHQEILAKQLTVREAEERVSCMIQVTEKKKESSKKRNIYLDDVVQSLEKRFATRVVIQAKNKGGGRISLEYHNLDDLNRLIDILKENA